MKQIIRAFLVLIASLLPLTAAEYFVSRTGSDEKNGTSETEAFATIQKGVDVMAAGDTLTILPGEYFEAVARKGLGATDVDTVIRAQKNGTVLLRGDKDVSESEKVDGYRFVYSFSSDVPPQAVNEIDTFSMLRVLTSLQEVDLSPGSYFYDEKAGKVYFSTTDLQPPSMHRYSVSVIPSTGFELQDAKRVTVKGLGATGFNSNSSKNGYGFNASWGFGLFGGQNCRLEELTAYLNGGGICTQNKQGFKSDVAYVGGNNLTLNCEAYGNGSQFNIEGGDIATYFPNGDVIDSCVSYYGFPNGIRLYQRPKAMSVLKNCFSRANKIGIQNKGKDAHELTRAERSISLTTMHSMQVLHNIIGDYNYYHRSAKVETSRDNIYLSRGNINPDLEFADPQNFDYRLQSNSQFRGSGPNGSDRGPHHYESNIFYVKINGDDQADGLSMLSAWKSMPQALQKLKAGDTLYVDAGEYDLGNFLWQDIGTAEAPVVVRGRGTQTIVLKGTMTIKDAKSLTLERLTLPQTLQVDGAGAIHLNNCTLGGSPGLVLSGAYEARITHCEFQRPDAPGLLVKNADSRIFLENNVFLSEPTSALEVPSKDVVSYSDYNLYKNPSLAWKVGGEATTLERLNPHLESYSPRTQIASGNLRGWGSRAQTVGRTLPFDRALRVTQPTVSSVTATTVNLEWFTSQPTTCEIRWGTTPEGENFAKFDANGLATYSLTGLQPGQRYYLRIIGAKVPEALSEQFQITQLSLPEEPVTFTTNVSDPAPMTYYVSAGGNNSFDGLSPEQAWATIGRAAEAVRPGDTVEIEPGKYSEQVVITVTGDRERPITFRAKKGGLVQMDGDQRRLTRAFVIAGKSYLKFDGFYFRDYGMAEGWGWMPSLSGLFNIYASDHIEITRCLSDGRGRGYAAPLIQAWSVKNLLVKNCVAVLNAGAIRLKSCPDAVVENNVVLRCNIQNLAFGNGPSEKVTLKNNILGDNQLSKKHVQTFEFNSGAALEEGNNCYFFRIPDAERKPFLLGDVGNERRLSVAEFNKRFGKSPSFVQEPELQGLKRVKDAAVEGEYSGDRMLKVEGLYRFTDFLPENQEVITRGMGLQPEVFEEYTDSPQ